MDVHDAVGDSIRQLKMQIGRLSNFVGEKFQSAGRNVERLYKLLQDWLCKDDIIFQIELEPDCSAESSSAHSGGRPKVDFETASYRTKKRRVEDLVTSRSVAELTTAAEVSLRLSGKRKAAQEIHNISSNSSSSSNSSFTKNTQPSFPRMLTANEALAYYVDSKSTCYSYTQTRAWSLKAGHAVFPCYKTLQRAKEALYPKKESITVTETKAEIKLQALLDVTAKRLVESLSDEVQGKLPQMSLKLTSKWGCDGSSNHSLYKQKLPSPDDSDEYLFLTSVVPLKLENEGEAIWNNPKPSSTLYCRPIKFMHAKENDELIKVETNLIEEQIKTLVPTSIQGKSGEILIRHELFFTMLDGKVVNGLTSNRNTQVCYICGAKPSNMNDPKPPSREMNNTSTFKHGLSILHASIKCFENLLHVSYRLKMKQYQVSKADKNNPHLFLKNKVRASFKSQMGLTVDKVVPGYGTSNDGNTARKFFNNPTLSASVTGINEELIRRLGFLLKALSSGYQINIEKLNIEAEAIRQLYIKLYSWYPMSVTLHKILVHCGEIVASLSIPIGQLSEEAQEARNKDIRRFRERNTRKCSRVKTNEDLLHHLLLTSDPLISSLRNPLRTERKQLPPEVCNLLYMPDETSAPVPDFLDDDEKFSDSEEGSDDDDSSSVNSVDEVSDSDTFSS